jgi:hypothetical protein
MRGAVVSSSGTAFLNCDRPGSQLILSRALRDVSGFALRRALPRHEDLGGVEDLDFPPGAGMLVIA